MAGSTVTAFLEGGPFSECVVEMEEGDEPLRQLSVDMPDWRCVYFYLATRDCVGHRHFRCVATSN